MKLIPHKYPNLSAQEQQDLCRKLFIAAYITGPQLVSHDNIPVIFITSIFDHAFTCGSQNARSFDFNRARRIYWIKGVIEKKVEDVTVLHLDVLTKKKRKSSKWNRIYYIPEKNYAVVLEYTNGKKDTLKFVTHYVTYEPWIRTKLKTQFGIK